MEPPREIRAGEEVVFGVGSKGLLREVGIGAAEGRLSYALEPPSDEAAAAEAGERVEFAIHWVNPIVSVPNVNERRCLVSSSPPLGGCGIVHVGSVSDDHHNFACVTVADPPVPGEDGAPPAMDLYADLRASQQAVGDGASPVPAAAVAEAEADPLEGLTLVELSERAGLDAELLEGMLEAMDGDESAVEMMLREQIASAPPPPPAP